MGKPVRRKPAVRRPRTVARPRANPYEAALSTVPRGGVVTFGELAVMATGHSTMGAMIHAGRCARRVPTDARSPPWWRVVASGAKPVGDLLQVERKDEQRRRLAAEGVDLAAPIRRAPSCLPAFLAPAFATAEIAPEHGHSCTLVYLHGRAFTGGYYVKHAHFFGAPRSAGLRVVLPATPARRLPTEWYSNWPPTGEDLATHREYVMDILRGEVRRLGGRADRVFLGGSSQGCILGLDLYVRWQHPGGPLGGFCGCVGYWPRCSDAVLARAHRAHPLRLQRPVRTLNGTADSIVPWAWARQGFRHLRDAGFDNLSAKGESCGHRLGEREGEWIRTFLDEVLPEP